MTDARTLTTALGGRWHGRYGTAPCPVCQPDRRKGQDALTISDGGTRLLVHCKKSACEFREIFAAAGIAPGAWQPSDPAIIAERETKERADRDKRARQAKTLWHEARPITGTHGETYLRGRGITFPLPDSLRWLPDAYHTPSGAFCAAMVADVSTGGIHRTFFDKKGNRLTTNAKMMFGPCAGGAVHLSGDNGPLVVCEGIETGLSLLSGLLSGPATVWAALSTSGMKGLRLPAQPGKLTIATDGDDPGREAGNRLAFDATALGWMVSLLPAPDGRDWNDVLQSGVAA